VEKT
jgi:hypothetical protein